MSTQYGALDQKCGPPGQDGGRQPAYGSLLLLLDFPSNDHLSTDSSEDDLTSTQKKVLVAIVDDDLRMRTALDTLLSAFGYAVSSFESAEAFLRVAASSQADCLLLDIQLGGISGLELTARLLEAGITIPIIFMTASGDDVVRRQAMKLNCIAYLRKPFTSDTLIEAILKATK